MIIAGEKFRVIWDINDLLKIVIHKQMNTLDIFHLCGEISKNEFTQTLNGIEFHIDGIQIDQETKNISDLFCMFLKYLSKLYMLKKVEYHLTDNEAGREFGLLVKVIHKTDSMSEIQVETFYK